MCVSDADIQGSSLPFAFLKLCDILRLGKKMNEKGL